MKSFETTIFIEPWAKGRPRLTTIGGHAHAYTPTKTRNAEAEIQIAIRNQVMVLGKFDAGVPIYLAATFYIEKPKSKPKKVTRPVTRPDLDNYVKTLMDALNKYVIPDDSQIVRMNIEKAYGTPPCIELLIREELE
jgi:Holliday junction resolvase RusA-like endonuclease